MSMFIVFEQGGSLYIRHSAAHVTLVCKPIGDDEFEPLYAVRRDGTQQQLPMCFQLSDDAREALKEFVDAGV